MKSSCVSNAVSGRSLLRVALLFLTTCSLAFAQTIAGGKGEIHGRISNQATGKTLVSATVAVVGSSRSVQSQADGTYILADMPAGPATLTVNYPGLPEQKMTITVPATGSVTQDVVFNGDTMALDPFVVNNPYEGNAAAIARQEKALVVKNVVSTDAWGNMSNGDMGSFLQHLPGVAGEYGGSAVDSILVRGMAGNFTSVSIDGSRIAVSNSAVTRTQVVSYLPADTIESVELVKTPTADMDADSLGGVVNMKTRSGFDHTGRAITFNASANYNETFGKHADPAHGNYVLPRFSLDYADTFSVLGGKNNLAVSVTAAHEDVAQVQGSFRLRFASNWDFVPGDTRLSNPVEEITNQYFTNKRDDWNVRFDYKLGSDSKITFGYGYNYGFNHLDAVRPDWTVNIAQDPSSTATTIVVNSNKIAAQRDIRDTGNTSNHIFLSGKHKLPGGFLLDWKLDRSTSGVSQDRISAKPYSTVPFSFIEQRAYDFQFPKIAFTSAFTPGQETFSSVSRMNLDGAENYRNYQYINTADLNLKKEFNGAALPFNIKAGFRVRQDHRDYDRDDFNYTSLTTGTTDFSRYADHTFNYPYLAGRYEAPTMFDVVSFYRDLGFQYVPGGGVGGRQALKYQFLNGSTSTDFQSAADIENTVKNSLISDFHTTETIPAGYVQSEIDLTPQLRMTAGIRFEQTKTEVITRATDLTQTTTEAQFGGWKTLDGKYNNTYPNIQFRYEPLKRLILRAAFSETIGRPDLGNFTSGFQPNATTQTISFGNPSIKPQQSKNFDLSAEYYFEPAGFISVGVFEKKITNFITSNSFTITGHEFGLDLTQYVGWTGSTNINLGTGTAKGLEFNYGQRFTFLPPPFSGLGVMANATWLQSTGDYGSTAIAAANPPFKKTLPNLRPMTGNLGLTYTRNDWDVRAVLNYQGDYLSGLNTGDFSRSSFFGARHQIDLNVRYKVNNTTSLFLDVVNLTSQNRRNYWGKIIPERLLITDIFSRQINAGVQMHF